MAAAVDTLDFTGFATALTIDLDTQAMQLVSLDGTTERLLQFIGQFENFIGGAGDDTVSADPLADLGIWTAAAGPTRC